MDKAELLNLILGVVALLVAWGMKQLAASKWSGAMEDQLFAAVASAAQRVKDKFLGDLAAAREATSDGGAMVTPAELSEARARALALVYESLKGPGLDYAKTRGADFIKGLIGGALDKILKREAIGVSSTAEPVPAPAGGVVDGQAAGGVK